MTETEVQWKVTWFPPEGDRTKTGTEKQVLAIAAREAEWYPIVEYRVIEVGEWVMVDA